MKENGEKLYTHSSRGDELFFCKISLFPGKYPLRSSHTLKAMVSIFAYNSS